MHENISSYTTLTAIVAVISGTVKLFTGVVIFWLGYRTGRNSKP